MAETIPLTGKKIFVFDIGLVPKNSKTSLFIVGSSMYAQLLIVICIVSVLSEVVTHNVPLQYYEGFFTYLYAVSILFFLYVFGYLLRSNNRRMKKLKQRRISKWRAQQAKNTTSVAVENELPNSNANESSVIRRTSCEEENEKTADTTVWFPATSVPVLQATLTEETTKTPVTFTPSSTSSQRRIKKMKVSENEHSHGSFFLRAGAVAFGLGTMIYDGLEFGAFLEIPPDSPCHALLRGVNPVLHATFVFLQMYFIFVSARLNIHKFKAVARFGLMHCLATNVCVWVRTLVRESLKEINGHYQMAGKHSTEEHHDALSDLFNKTKEHPSLWELTGNVSCGRRILLGDVIMDAAPFLYPFLIEYSLIGAAVLYVLWAHIGLNPRYIGDENEENPEKSHLRVDCLGASKGLFVGLFLLAASLLCLVLFFVFAPQKEFRLLGLVLADAAHCALLLVSLAAMAIGVYRVQHLTFHSEHTEELGNLLLRVSALGIFAYSVFSMIAGALSPWTDEPPLLVLINGLLSVVQVTAQMLFISDMSRRRITTPEQDRTKPGRQTVTFLLITNLTLWVVYTFEMQKVEANPVQLNFYGFLPWAVVQRITLPLCIFYRFHSAIVFAEIWKNTYRFS